MLIERIHILNIKYMVNNGENWRIISLGLISQGIKSLVQNENSRIEVWKAEQQMNCTLCIFQACLRFPLFPLPGSSVG